MKKLSLIIVLFFSIFCYSQTSLSLEELGNLDLSSKSALISKYKLKKLKSNNPKLPDTYLISVLGYKFDLTISGEKDEIDFITLTFTYDKLIESTRQSNINLIIDLRKYLARSNEDANDTIWFANGEEPLNIDEIKNINIDDIIQIQTVFISKGNGLKYSLLGDYMVDFSPEILIFNNSDFEKR